LVLSSTIEEVCTEVLKRVNPSEVEQKKVQKLAQKLTENLEKVANDRGIDAKIGIEGSVAKNTWLRDCPEIDVFLQLPTTIPREAFGTIILDVAKKAMEGYKQIKRFAEHPYLESVVENVYVNIVPCYRVKSGEWISATDRTPFHTNYIKPHIDEQKGREVRLLKRFMKGVGVYGAEIKIGGFSGYLCELLVLNYGSFVEVLWSVGNWEERPIIDIEGNYERKDDVTKIFEEPLCVVDPVDKARNVAAAVRKERLDEFIAASRAFIKNPDLKFFYPLDTEALTATELVKRINIRGSTFVFVYFEAVASVPDILWGQLYKSQKALVKLIEQHGFTILNHNVWSDEIKAHIFVFEMENRFLPTMKRHVGPPLQKRLECEKFLLKHTGSESTVSGPRLENGCWVVDVKRKDVDVINLLKVKMQNNTNRIGLAEIVSKAITDSVQVLVNDEVLKFYSVYPEFAKFLTEYIEGKPRWLI
jgi:tRNA nucleotidyltransferase (CCA-adding enzyme)